jgi:hypothetical protein
MVDHSFRAYKDQTEYKSYNPLISAYSYLVSPVAEVASRDEVGSSVRHSASRLRRIKVFFDV